MSGKPSGNLFEAEHETARDPDDETFRKKLLQNTAEIFSSPSDPDVETIVKRIENKDLILRPKFQRAEVWNNKLKSRLVESVLLNLPVPPVFVAEDDDSTKVVVDGQQRLQAIDDFYHGRFALSDLEIYTELNGKKLLDLEPRLQRRFKQRVLRMLTIPYSEELDVRFLIFERLNTNTVPLNDQEIRNATLGGPLNDLLARLVKEQLFLLALRKDKPDERLRHHEVILRFLAVHNQFEEYSTPLRLFLTDYMRANRRLKIETEVQLDAKFNNALQNTISVFGNFPFRRYNPKLEAYQGTISRAVFELQMVTFADLDTVSVKDKAQEIEQSFVGLCADPKFSELLTRGTDHRKRFYRRFWIWLSELERMGIASPLLGKLPPHQEFLT